MNSATLSSLTLASLLAASGVAAADEAASQRVVRASEGFARDHADDELRDPRSFENLVTAPTDVVTKSRQGPRGPKIAAATFGDSYVFEGFTDLFSDRDRDGYFHYLRVTFDVDTIFPVSYVYAMVWLSADGNSWERVYTTADFAVYATSPDDDYEVETDLVSGYSTGLYDVLVEIYDAGTDVLVDEYGPNESPEFSLLPLEDANRDGDAPPSAPPPGEPVVVEDGGGGASSWLALPFLLAALAANARRRQMAHCTASSARCTTSTNRA
jgi:hypothetical protein